MTGAALGVHAAPGSLRAGEPFVLAVTTPDTTLRAAARDRARGALRALLAPALGCMFDEVPLQCEPGSAPRLALDAPHIGIAIAHEAGLSLVAPFPGGLIGADLMRVEPVPDWEIMARDYLGPGAHAVLARIDETGRAEAFAAAWTRFEAVLKCHGRQLAEWTAELAQLMSNTHSLPLALPKGYAGHVAWRAE
jgi:4'-phosphopantetheinyl transferase